MEGLYTMYKLIILVCVISGTTGRSVKTIDNPEQSLNDDSLWNDNTVLFGVVSVAGFLSMVLLLVGCAEICQRQDGFKDFENDDVFSPEVETPPPVSSEFTMYPPVESTPDVISAGPIVFEPLPDPIQLKRQTLQAVNTKQLRPKVAIMSRERTESEDSLDDPLQQQQDITQNKVKLHNLIVNSRNQIPRSQLQYIKEMGNGWFGKVLQGEGMKILPGHKKTKVVIQMLKEDMDTSDQLAFLQEGIPYREVDNPNVLRLLGQCVDTNPYLTILELCPFGDVKTYLRSHRIAVESFNEKGLLLKFACDMAAGLQALNQQGYIHRDFAARNCLLASDLSVKVGDYGFSEETYKEDYLTDAHGDSVPIRWLGPETLHVDDDQSVYVKHITKESNVWSFGVTLWEIITFGNMPYGDLSNDHVLRLVIKERSLKPTKPDMPVSHLDRLYQLMWLCWTDSPFHRPSLRELRIMLLHLMSNKLSTDSTAFDQKWNQLMPRRPPQVAKVAPQPQMQPTIATIDTDPLKAVTTQPKRPTGFESNFVELNPSLLGNAGSLESELESDLAPIHRHGPMTSPFNELSLDAELANQQVSLSEELGQAVESSKTESAGNELSLAAELSQAHSPTESEAGDDVIEIHTEERSPTPEQTEVINEVTPTPKEPEIIIQSPDTPIVQATEDGQVKSPDQNLFTKQTSTSSASSDFMTSTPVKADPPVVGNSPAATGTSPSLSSPAMSSSFYQTALSSQVSTEEEPSILGSRKFAACLQTVVTSFDGDEFDPLSLSGSVDEEVFKIPHPSIPEENEEKENQKNNDESKDSQSSDAEENKETAENSSESNDSHFDVFETVNENNESEKKNGESNGFQNLAFEISEENKETEKNNAENNGSDVAAMPETNGESKLETDNIETDAPNMDNLMQENMASKSKVETDQVVIDESGDTNGLGDLIGLETNGK